MNTITIPTKPQLTTEAFSIPLEINRYIVYAPLKRVAFIANASMVNFIADLQAGYYDKEDDRQNILINFLRQIQLIDSGADNYPITEFHGLPKPTAVSLFLTTACNLRCTYCYASSGETPARHMSIETARHGIDFIIQNAVKQGVDTIEIAYHGGGEPTVNWVTLTESLAYTRQQASQQDLKVTASLASNGVLSKEHCQWIIQNLDGVSLSFDGLPKTHDQHRLTVNGKGSSAQVLQTLAQFDAANFRYGIRVTVTADQIESMPDAVDFIYQNFKPVRIQLDPAYQMGRWANASSAETQSFIDFFKKAKRRARSYGRDIDYSAARFGLLTNHFCGLTQDSFCLSTDGKVTGCYEVFSEDVANAEVFFYGKPDATNGYQFDLKTLTALRHRAVQYREFCQGCFAKWSCAGDCFNKALQVNDNNELQGSDRCHITRELTKDQILDAIANAGDLVWQAGSDNLLSVPKGDRYESN